jgi:hypothetical protein
VIAKARCPACFGWDCGPVCTFLIGWDAEAAAEERETRAEQYEYHPPVRNLTNHDPHDD